MIAPVITGVWDNDSRFVLFFGRSAATRARDLCGERRR